MKHRKYIDNSKIFNNRFPPSINIKPYEWSLDLLKEIDWKNFEHLCANYFKAKGRKAEVTNLGADEGINIILYELNDTERILGIVQCKAWKRKLISVKHIRELLGIMTDKGCPLGFPSQLQDIQMKHSTLQVVRILR